MGIRFACHHCQKRLNVKGNVAGKRGVCPHCGGRFRIPLDDAPYSFPIGNGDTAAVSKGPVGTSPGNSVSLGYDDESSGQVNGIVEVTASMSATGKSSFQAATRSSTAGNASRAASLLDDPTAVWYVRPPSGGQYGPATGDVLRSWITEARVTPTSLVWRDGWPQWRSASDALVEFGGNMQAEPKPSMMHVQRPSSSSGNFGAPSVPSLKGDAAIGMKKGERTDRRFIIIGSLAALAMTLVGLLIYLVKR